MKEIDVWATYNFECENENCDHMQTDLHDEFEWNPEEGCNTMTVECEKCGTVYLAKKPE